MARCTICADPELAKAVDTLVRFGRTDVAIGHMLGVSRMAVHRHRVGHTLAQAATPPVPGAAPPVDTPAAPETLTGAAGDDLDAPPGPLGRPLDPSDLVQRYFGMPAAARRLERLQRGLEGAIARAEKAGSAAAIAQLAAQMLRSIELGGRIAQIPGLVPAREGMTVPGGPGFNVTFNFHGTEPLTITGLPVIPAEGGEAQPADESGASVGAQAPQMPSIFARRGR